MGKMLPKCILTNKHGRQSDEDMKLIRSDLYLHSDHCRSGTVCSEPQRDSCRSDPQPWNTEHWTVLVLSTTQYNDTLFKLCLYGPCYSSNNQNKSSVNKLVN